jgi:hypothetical protein
MAGLGIQILEPAEELGPQPGALGDAGPLFAPLIDAAWSQVYMRTFLFALGGAATGFGAGYAFSSKRKRVRNGAWGAVGGGLTAGAIRFFIGWREVEAVRAAVDAAERATQP